MTNTIINGAPMVISYGVNDKSKRQLPLEPDALPSHLPKIFLFAQKGPTTPQLVVGSTRNTTYGNDTFDLRKTFANHQTVLSNVVNSEGNAQMIERVIPTDAGPKSNFRLSIEILSTQIPLYQRDTNGRIKLDSVGAPLLLIPAETISGHKVRWIVESVTTKTLSQTDSDLFGVASIVEGTLIDNGVKSNIYPILEFWASSQGSFFNNSGLRIWSPTTLGSNTLNKNMINVSKVYPFRMAAIARVSANTSTQIVTTESGEQYFDFCLKPHTINPSTDLQFHLSDLYLDKYENTKDKRYPIKYADLNGLHVYQDNIDTVLSLLTTTESPYFSTEGSDFSSVDSVEENKYRYNIFSLMSSSGVTYNSVIQVQSSEQIIFTEGTNIYAKGGSDGTMSPDMFNGLVETSVNQYALPTSDLMDTAMNPESIIYDSGFPLRTKLALCNALAIRKDIFVVLSPYEVDGQKLSISEGHSIAVSLKSKLQMYPESDYFGTPIYRGLILRNSGELRNSQYSKRLPLTIELAKMWAKFAGGSDGNWKLVDIFDKAPNNVISMFDNIDNTFIPANQNNKDFDAGLNNIASFSRNSYYLPSLKTVYDDDTSVLNSMFTAMCCIELQKVGERVHRLFSGTTTLSNNQLIERVNEAVLSMTNGRFAGMFTIVPNASISSGDESRGYSYTLIIKLYSNNSKTVMSLNIETYRLNDLTK